MSLGRSIIGLKFNACETSLQKCPVVEIISDKNVRGRCIRGPIVRGEIFLDPKSHVPKFPRENIFGPKHLGTDLSQFRNVTGPLCFGTKIFRCRNDPGSKCPGPDFHRLKRVNYPWPNHSGTETSQFKHYLGLISTGTEMTLEHVSWNQNV